MDELGKVKTAPEMVNQEIIGQPQVEAISKNDTLKVIAVISMLIDHIGYVLFPQHMFLRVIGRIAFPIFAYSVTAGYTNTRNLKKYAMRLLLFALISQIPYHFFSPGKLNIMFTLLYGLGCIYFIDKKKYILLFLAAALSVFVPMDYGTYGVFVTVLFYIYRDNPKLTVISQVAVTLAYVLLHNISVQFFCVVSLLFILKKWKINIVLNKYFFYVFYPAHITILLLIAKLF